MLWLVACTPPPVDNPPVRFREDAVFLVWMPYDNDLHQAVGPVLAGLQAGSAHGVEVAVQVDRPDQPGMERVTFRDGVGHTSTVPHEDSGSKEALDAFLDWASVRYEARAYAAVVLDHGGDLYSLARDDNPGSWLSMQDLTASLTAFDDAEPGRLQLTFLQVCGKASLEPLQVLAPASDVIVATQLPLYAPNTWYESGLKAIAQAPGADGQAWCRDILGAEGPQMFHTLTCFDGPALQAFQPDVPLLTEERLDTLAHVTWPYAEEIYVDLGALVPVDEVVVQHVVSDDPPQDAEGFPSPNTLSGLSIAVPSTPTKTGSRRTRPGRP